MKLVDEFRHGGKARALASRIAARTSRPWVLMEICGGQTHTILRYGLDQLLPDGIRLVHGPGCPVCVTPLEILDQAVALAADPDVTFVSYGDMLRVPGSSTDLLRVRAAGGDVRIVYSPMEAVRIAEAEPTRRVIFFAIGFETTAPAHAMAVKQARAKGLGNLTFLVSHVRVPPAIRLLLASASNRVQGFIAPGHVCTVMGWREYEVLSREFDVPFVVGGFEPLDLLESVRMLVDQLEEGRVDVENQYTRSVRREGNRVAQRLVNGVFEVCERTWRGIGPVERGGLRLRPEYAAFDAATRFELGTIEAHEPDACIAAEVLQGRRTPAACPAFGTSCTPASPLGAPMVSGEGACAAWWRYRRNAGEA